MQTSSMEEFYKERAAVSRVNKRQKCEKCGKNVHGYLFEDSLWICSKCDEEKYQQFRDQDKLKQRAKAPATAKQIAFMKDLRLPVTDGCTLVK